MRIACGITGASFAPPGVENAFFAEAADCRPLATAAWLHGGYPRMKQQKPAGKRQKKEDSRKAEGGRNRTVGGGASIRPALPSTHPTLPSTLPLSRSSSFLLFRFSVFPFFRHSAAYRLPSSFLSSAFCLLTLCLLSAGCSPRKPEPGTPGGKPRIVSLSPSITEILCAVGAAECLVGRSSYCDYPAEAVKSVPMVGDFCSPSLEKLVAVRPTLVLEVDSADSATDRHLAALGIPVRRIACGRLDDIPRAIREIGGCAGRGPEAERLAAEFEADLERLRRQQPAPTECPLVFVEIWPDPLMTAGKDSFIAELVRLAGGRNAGDRLAREYAPVSAEWLVACNPDVVLCLNDAPSSRNPLPAWRKRNGMSVLCAVQSGRVLGGFNLDVMLKPGPRVLQSVAELRRALRAPPAAPRG